MSRVAMLLPPAAFAAALALAAPAQTSDDAYAKCLETAMTNPEMAQCGSAWLERLDVELNRVWKTRYAALDPEAKKAMLDEQRAWIAYKDKSCVAWAVGDYGRQGQVLDFYMCRAGVIGERIGYLTDFGYRGEDGPVGE